MSPYNICKLWTYEGIHKAQQINSRISSINCNWKRRSHNITNGSNVSVIQQCLRVLDDLYLYTVQCVLVGNLRVGIGFHVYLIEFCDVSKNVCCT